MLSEKAVKTETQETATTAVPESIACPHFAL